MTQATLLRLPDDPAGRDAFTFDHAMAHRAVFAAMGPLDQWSVLPYFIDPTAYDARPGTNWHLNHQTAHNDFIEYLPPNPFVPAHHTGIQIAQNLLDTEFNREDSLLWWTFDNHQHHFLAMAAIYPLDLTADPLPWWLLAPRLVTNFW